MKLRCILSVLALVAGTAHATPLVNGGPTEAVDNTTEFLTGLHAAAPESFIDHFSFSVSAPSAAFAAIDALTWYVGGVDSGLATPLGFTGMLLTDAANQALAQDVDGSDGWSLASLLGSAGTYHLYVGGNKAASADAGYYLGFVTTAATAVPEPASAALLLSALGLAAVGRRRRG